MNKIKSKIRCIAVDDQKPSLDILENYCQKIPFIEWAKGYTSPVLALNELDEIYPDVIFLDVEMPEINGIDFVKMISKEPKPLIVYISDFPQYAFDTYQVERDYDIKIMDYLKKIISFDAFLKSMNRCREHLLKKDHVANLEQPTKKVQIDSITVKDSTKYFNILLNDIVFIEGEREYAKYHLSQSDKILSERKTLESIIEGLKEFGFIQVNKSVIVNTRYIHYYTDKDVVIFYKKGDREISIGPKFKKDFMAYYADKRL